MRIERLGESAVILVGESLTEVLRWQESVVGSPLVVESLPCYVTLTLFLDLSRCRYEEAMEVLLGEIAEDREVSTVAGDTHVIPVCYEGEYAPDLEELASHVGCSPEEVVALHSGAEYVVAGLGFSPGFGFLQGLPEQLRCPRKARPRARVPKGALGIANDQTGVYPSETSGGWNLIGRTPLALVNYSEVSPSRFAVGDRVRFQPISCDEYAQYDAACGMEVERPDDVCVEVVGAGMLATIQDLGRTEYRSQGLPHGGAMDPRIVKQMNRFLGNASDAPVIEFCQIGPQLRFAEETRVMVGGNCLPSIDGLTRSSYSILTVRAGEVLDCGRLMRGTWGYVAVVGGFLVEKKYGSASTHPHLALGGLRGTVLQAGDRIPYEPDRRLSEGIGIPYAERVVMPRTAIQVMPGPQWDWFSSAERERFLSSAYQVSMVSNRVGYRLAGPVIEKPDRELISEGACPGVIQITNEGQPIVLMRDSQLIGGYPKIACVTHNDLARLAQLRPGTWVRFALT